MSYIPSDEDLSQYEYDEPSFGRKAIDYEKGYGAQLLQSGENAARFIGNLPSKAYEAITDKSLYNIPEYDFTKFIPQSEAGQTGKHVGENVADIASLLIPGKLGLKGLRAALRYHPLTKGQLGRQIQGPLDILEQGGSRSPLGYRQLQEINDLLSHPALESGGRAGRALTSQGRNAILDVAAEGRPSGLHSAQSLLGDLERVLPQGGEALLSTTRVRPLKEQLLEAIKKGAGEVGLEKEADKYLKAREAARRYYRTRKAIKKISKPLGIAALLKTGITGIKNLP